MSRDDSFSQLVIVDFDLGVLVDRHAVTGAQLLLHPRVRLDVLE